MIETAPFSVLSFNTLLPCVKILNVGSSTPPSMPAPGRRDWAAANDNTTARVTAAQAATSESDGRASR
jgi:hypothetical protein